MMKEYIDFSSVKVNDNLTLSIKEAGKTVDEIKSTEKVTKIIFTALTYVFIVFLALLMMFPFYWMIITSLKQFSEINSSKNNYQHIFLSDKDHQLCIKFNPDISSFKDKSIIRNPLNLFSKNNI